MTVTYPSIVLAAPPYLPPPLVLDPGWGGLVMTWTGFDGHEWSLTSHADGSGLVLMTGVQGLGAPTFTHFRDTYASMHGSRWRDYRANAREVFWPLYLFHDESTAEWRQLNRAFTRTMSPRKTGVWKVTSPGQPSRSLRLRYEKGLEGAFSLDPTKFGWAKYGIYLTADQPYWEGTPIARTWTTADPIPFFDAAGSPPLHISGPPRVDTATLTNPGDVESWPVWTFTGPMSGAEVGVGGQTVSWEMELAEGDTLVVDTRPTAQTAMLNGVDVTASLLTFGFAEIPEGANVPLTVLLDGIGGTARVELTPLYEWGF